jgi:hypothetical protein
VAWGRDFFIGACLPRADKDEVASRLLAKCVDRAPSGQDETGNGDLALMKYFLALARGRLGHVSQARRLLAEANEHKSHAGDLDWNWRLRVDLDSLRKEVEGTLQP